MNLRAYASHFITWCQKWEPEKILDPPLETFNALGHASLPTKVGKHIKFSYIEHSQTTWQIDSNHRLRIGPLQRTFTSDSNSSNGDANLFSKDRSTKSKRRTKWDCCCYGLAINASKSIIRPCGPAMATTSKLIQLLLRSKLIQSPRVIAAIW